jgi:NAD-dependent deacetylase
MIERDRIEEAGWIIANAKYGVVFTGAGISAESGIPTFRGEDGLWKKYDPKK